LRDEKFVDKADALFRAHVNEEIRLVAPFAIYYEFPASVLNAVREGRLDDRSAVGALRLFFDLDMPIIGGTRESAARISQAAYRLASTLGCSYYDGVFLGLAQLLGTVVVSADDKLQRNIGSRTPLFVWIEDYAL
jgi:predicted nucleic acid-binding protein